MNSQRNTEYCNRSAVNDVAPSAESHPVTVRAARRDELEQVGQLTLEAYLADGVVQPGGAYARELADASRRAQDAELLVAADPQGRLLGTITVCTPDSPLGQLSRPGELEFRMLAVAPSARRRGVAERLVRAVLAQANEIGAHRVVLCSTVDMCVAHRLYTRLGFRRLPERDWQPVSGTTLLAFGVTTGTSQQR